MAKKACHTFASTTQVGLIQVLGRNSKMTVNPARIVTVSIALALIAFVSLLQPSWPRDLWLQITTRNLQFEFTQKSLRTERNAYQPDQPLISPDNRTVTALVSLNCNDVPGQPSATVRSDIVYLSIHSEPSNPNSQMAASCGASSNSASFDLGQPIRSGQKIVFLADAAEKASLVAP